MIIIAVIALIITMMSIANVWASEATDYEARQVCGPPKLEPPQVFLFSFLRTTCLAESQTQPPASSAKHTSNCALICL